MYTLCDNVVTVQFYFFFMIDIVSLIPLMVTVLALILAFIKDVRERRTLERQKERQLAEDVEKTQSYIVNTIHETKESLEARFDEQTAMLQADIRAINVQLNKLATTIATVKTKAEVHEKKFSHDGTNAWLQEMAKSLGRLEDMREQIKKLESIVEYIRTELDRVKKVS